MLYFLQGILYKLQYYKLCPRSLYIPPSFQYIVRKTIKVI
jgi:hypothetical protein